MSNTTINTCLTTIYDDGGPTGDYTENDYQMTICASSGNVLHFVIQELILGAAFNGDSDVLTVYEGTGTGGNILFDSNINSSPSTVISSNDPCITITIETDPSFFNTPVAAGFSILVSCSVPETCNDGILNNGEVMVDCGGPNCTPCYQATSCGPNVITNGDFEQTTTACSTGTDSPSSGQIFIDVTNTDNWYGTSTTTGNGSGITPDLFNNNCAGNSSIACFGSPASMGFFTGAGSGNNIREYIQTQLSTPLVAGVEYCITVDVTAGSAGGSDGLGFWFHNNGIIDIDTDNAGDSFLGTGTNVNGQPQAENPSGNVFSDTSCEQLILGFCANGGEEYLTIGNFKTDANTLPGGTSYLIIDNLVVSEACPPSFNASIIASGTPDCLGGCVDLYAITSNQTGGCQITNDFTFQWYENGNPIPGQTNDTLFNVCPTNTSTYSVEITYSAGCSSVTLPENQTSITFNCGGFTLNVDATPPSICSGNCTDLTATPDVAGTYTYSWNIQGNTTVIGTTQTINVCPTSTTTYEVTANDGSNSVNGNITVTVENIPNAGTTGNATFCSTDPSSDLYNYLNGSPDVGGTWSPTLASGNGIFDPGIDPDGTYTYTVSNICGSVSTDVIVTTTQGPNSGIDGAVTLCTSDPAIDLFGQLGGTPDLGGIWSPSLNSGNNTFDPNIDPGGIYTYTVSNGCGSSSSNVTVTITNNPSAGTNGSVIYCYGDSADDLFNHLGGTADLGGTWSPPLNSGSGIFDPSVDPPGTYTYTLNACGGGILSADVVVTVNPLPDAGLSNTVNFCSSDAAVDLTSLLGGTPDQSGTWTPSLTSGSGVFDPSTDPPGNYTYTVTNSCGTSTADMTLTVDNCDPPTAAFTTSNASVCLGECITFTDASLGTITNWDWDFGGSITPNNSTDQNPVICPDSVGTFVISLTVSNGFGSSTITSDIQVNEIPSVTAGVDTTIEMNGIATLTAIGNPPGGTYLWNDNSLDCQECSIITVSPIYNNNYSVLYTSSEGCSVEDEVMVNVNFQEYIGVPNGFSPNGDGMNDILFVEGEGIVNMTFVIYNRYGNKVFESVDQNIGWDGTYMSYPENPGVFAWHLNYVLIDGTSGVQSGNVTLIK